MGRKHKLPQIIHKNLVEKDNVVGWAYLDTNKIELDSALKGKEYLITVIHEATHLFFPHLSEKTVDEYSTYIGEILWRQKYRKKNKKV